MLGEMLLGILARSLILDEWIWAKKAIERE